MNERRELVICKSCGFVMDKSKLKDKCPACGVPAKMFEPYTEKISPKRKLLLSLDIHPILVHFPQAFTFSLLALSLVALVVHGTLQATIGAAVTVLGFMLPFTVILAFFAGMLDGKVRFRRVTTPILVRKMVLGILFFLFSSGVFAVVCAMPMTTATAFLSVAGLSLPALGCATVLAQLGTSILNAKFPG